MILVLGAPNRSPNRPHTDPYYTPLKGHPKAFSRFIVPSGDQAVEQWIIEACKLKKWRSDLGVPANKIPSISKHLRGAGNLPRTRSCRMIRLIHRIQPLGHGGHGAGGDSGGEKPRESNLDWWNLPPWQNQTKWSRAGTAGGSLQNGQLETSVARILAEQAGLTSAPVNTWKNAKFSQARFRAHST